MVMPLPEGERVARLEAMMEAQTTNIDRLTAAVEKQMDTRSEGWKEFREGIQACLQTCAALSAWRHSCELGWQSKIINRVIDLGIVGAGVLFWLAVTHGLKPF